MVVGADEDEVSNFLQEACVSLLWTAMRTSRVLQSVIAAALSLGALVPAVNASAGNDITALPGFESSIPGVGGPLVDPPTFRGDCDDKKSPSYGWCLPDFAVVDFGPPLDGDGYFIDILNRGHGTSESLWVTVTVHDGVFSRPFVGEGPTRRNYHIIQRSWSDPNVYIVEFPDGIASDRGAAMRLFFDLSHPVDVTIEANYHADAEQVDYYPLDNYRIAELTHGNNTLNLRRLARPGK